MDSIVSIAIAIKREIDDAQSIRDTGASDRKKEGQPSSTSKKKQKTFIPSEFQG